MADTAGRFPQGRLTLQQRLGVLVVAATLPLAVYALVAAGQAREREYADTRASALSVVRLLASEFSRQIEHTRQLLTAFSLSASSGMPLSQLCDPGLRRFVEHSPHYHQAVVADLSGNLVCGTRPYQPGTGIADRSYFQSLLKTRGFVTSSFITSRTTGYPTIAAAYPLLSTSGEMRGAVVVSLDLAWLQRSFEKVSPGPGMIASLLDRSGTIVLRYPRLDKAVGRVVERVDEFLSLGNQSGEGVVEARGLDAVDRIVAFTRLGGNGEPHGYVRVGVPVEVVDRVANNLIVSGLTVFGVVALLTLLLAWYGSRKLMIAPINSLIDAANRIGIDDLSIRTGLADDRTEIGRLAKVFDQMAARLQRSVRALRTLSAGNRIVIRRQTEPELLLAMCGVAVEKGGYKVAMVHYAMDDPGKSVTLQAHAGGHEDYVGALNFTWADCERGQGAVGTAIRTGRYDVIRNITDEPRTAPWREESLRRGFVSVIAFPLRVEKRVIGTYTLIAAEPDAFDADEIELLREMADDLAFGIETIRARNARDQAEATAAYAASHDPVTELPNRSEMLGQVIRQIGIRKSSGGAVAVLVAYFPRMQELFDALGYDASNRLLRDLGKRLSIVKDTGGFLARVSFDDFGIVLPDQGPQEAIAISHYLHRLLRQPLMLEDAAFEVQATIGLANFPEHGDVADLLVRRAGLAAREGARKDAIYYEYRGTSEREDPQRLTMATELRRAIENHELVLHYQPKINLRTGRMLSVEALVRWSHPSRGMISPARFVPLAEQTGLIHPMTLAILEMSVAQQDRWTGKHLHLPIAVNLSARSLHDMRFIPRFSDILSRAGVPPDLVELEITESALMDDPDIARAQLQILSENGCRIYVDDFGTGYSCLSYLVDLPVHALKIDRSFVSAMTDRGEARSMVASIISMTHGLGLQVVAEGVEAENEATLLLQMGCDDAQGYFYSRPVPAEDLEALVASGKLKVAE